MRRCQAWLDGPSRIPPPQPVAWASHATTLVHDVLRQGSLSDHLSVVPNLSVVRNRQ
jgi:hypothetical protein